MSPAEPPTDAPAPGADAPPAPGSPSDVGAVVVIGAGPAGLTAAYQFHKYGVSSTVVEADEAVGGISQTVRRDGWRFDLGGHRFFTKVQEVEDLWHEILPDEDFLLRPRKSRIFYEGKFYDYPLKAGNALRNLGLWEAALCVGSYVWARVRPPRDQSDYESWLVARFGWRLYRTFFKTYSEKVWGVPVSSLPADFAAQRVKELSLSKAIINAVLPKRNQKEITSLIEEFQYPRYGPGMMWEVCRDKVVAQGSTVRMRQRVTRVRHRGGRAVEVTTAAPDGSTTTHPADHVISSMPISELLHAMDPPVPAEVHQAAADLSYRDFLTVALVVPAGAVDWDDNWIYVHAPQVEVGRIQNFGSWSPFMVKDGKNVLGLEYFVFEGDRTWTSPDEQLIAQATRELAVLGLVDEDAVEGGYVVRVPKAYPTYDERYQANVGVLRRWLAEHAANVHPVGRNGMFRYNNQDHSMFTAMLTVENICLGTGHDVWNVNVEEEYHETLSRTSTGRASGGSLGTGRDAPVVPRADVDRTRAARGVDV